MLKLTLPTVAMRPSVSAAALYSFALRVRSLCAPELPRKSALSGLHGAPAEAFAYPLSRPACSPVSLCPRAGRLWRPVLLWPPLAPAVAPCSSFLTLTRGLHFEFTKRAAAFQNLCTLRERGILRFYKGGRLRRIAVFP